MNDSWCRTIQASHVPPTKTQSGCSYIINSPETLKIKSISLFFSNLNCKNHTNVSLIRSLWRDCMLEVQHFLTDSLFVLHKKDLKAKHWLKGAWSKKKKKKEPSACILICKCCSSVRAVPCAAAPFSVEAEILFLNQVTLFYFSKKKKKIPRDGLQL